MNTHEDLKSGSSNGSVRLPIREWHATERPREKLLHFGPSFLSTAELIGLIIGSGASLRTGSMTAIQLGQVLVSRDRSLRALSNTDVLELTAMAGMGPAKAARLVSAFELGRRVEADPETERIRVTAPEDVARVFIPLMRDLKREVFKVITLNSAGVITGENTVSEGGLAASIVEPRAVFRRAVLGNAASLICVHNHPSGNPEPSEQDLRITRQLVEAGKLMGIPVHDHIIIAGSTYTSLAGRGLI